jgi:hypothetical protein
MSDIQIVMKFEFLPNEILIDCFGYLNALHIFHSFDQLNYRLNQLIRNIHRKIIFDRLLSNQEIKKQIIH